MAVRKKKKKVKGRTRVSKVARAAKGEAFVASVVEASKGFDPKSVVRKSDFKKKKKSRKK